MPPASPTSGAVTIHPNSEQTSTRDPKYSESHQRHINFRRQRMIAARDARAQKQNKFDDMTFDQWWEKNELADNSYVKPRKNKEDTEINMGVVRDKDNTLLALALKHAYEPSAQCFDENDNMLQELAEEAEDLIIKSRQLEEYTEKAKLIYRGMLTFGTQLVEEVYLERWTLDKKLSGKLGDKGATWADKLVKLYDGCIARPWDLRKCYFGDLNKFHMNGPLGQPFFFTVEYLDYDSTKAIFEQWDMWDCVPNQVVWTPELQTLSSGGFVTGWSLQPITQYQCEIIRYYDPVANEFGITINGIDMLPVMSRKTKGKDGVEVELISGFPLTAVSPSGAIPFAKFDNEPMHNFAYSKSVPSKTRIIADVEDMVVKLMILGMKQMRRPPKGNKSNRIFSKDIFLPGTMTNDVREGEIFDLLPNQNGIQPAEFSFYEAMKAARDENTVTRNFTGDGSPVDTATQAMQDKEGQMDKIALMLDGVMAGEKQLFWLRTYNIFANWTKPIDQRIDKARGEISDVYRTVSMEKEIDGRAKGHKHTRFTTEPVPGATPEEKSLYVHQEEGKLSKERGTEVRISYLNPKIIQSMRLRWFYTVQSVPKSNDSMGQMMFAKAITDAINFFGPESLNVAKLKRKYAIKYNQDYEDFFVDEDTLATQQQVMMNQQAATGGAAPVSKGVQKPTIGNQAQGKRPMVAMK